MALELKIIEGKKLMERWGLSALEVLFTTANQHLTPVQKYPLALEWETVDWDIVAECAQNDKSKIDVSGFVFLLSDVIQLEDRCNALKTGERFLISGRGLMKRWGRSEVEVGEILDTHHALAVDATGVELKGDLAYFLMMEPGQDLPEIFPFR